MPSLVTVATFNYPHEVAIPRARLESEGIPCHVKDEKFLGLEPFFAANGSGIKLQVNEEDVEDALKILRDAGYVD
jgi:hypothetical protein